MDVASVSTRDDDVTDMLQGDLFTREWRIVGNCSLIEPGHQSDHLIMFYEQIDFSSPDRIVDIEKSAELVPVSLSILEQDSVEIIPVSVASLGKYYNYFQTCVCLDARKDSLVSICKRRKKSPCFDIRRCCLVKSLKNADLVNFTMIKIGNIACVPLIPSSAVLSIIDSISNLDISIVPMIHDANAFNGCRIRMSSRYTECEIVEDQWKQDSLCENLSSFIKTDAVATATFTVSVVLSTVYGQRSKYLNKKALTIVIHSIK